MTRLRRLAVDLPLAWKLLVPLLVLLLLVGTLGTFVLVRDQATRARTALDADLQHASLETRSVARDRELYLAESGNFAANLQGVAEAATARDGTSAAHLLQSVMALKTDLLLAALTDSSGRTIAQYSRARPGAVVSLDPAGSLQDGLPMSQAVASAQPTAALAGFTGRRQVLLATPVCTTAPTCRPVGFTMVGIDAASVVIPPQGVGGHASEAVAAVYDDHNLLAAQNGGSVPPRLEAGFATGAARVVGASGSSRYATLYTPYTLQGRRAGTIAVTLPTAPAFSSVQAATVQLVLLLLAAIAGTVTVVGALAAYILSRLSQLVATNRALESGDLTARAPVAGADEIGQLARGVNAMAQGLQDIYENLETRVEERTTEVRRLLQERTEFFTAVSHELRTPLAVIQAHADMLSADDFARSPAWQMRAGESIGAAAGQLLAFVNDILDLSKAETGALELALQEVRVEDVVSEVQPSAQTIASTSGVAISFTLPGDLPSVAGDPRRLRQALMNLVDNAVKYTPRGGSVDVSARLAGGEVELVVRDSGVGIPADALDRIFEPFYRVPHSQPQNGQPSSGVGLALVRRIVDAHGGRIAVESGPRVPGTVFTVALPVAPGAGEHPVARPRKRPRRGPAPEAASR